MDGALKPASAATAGAGARQDAARSAPFKVSNRAVAAGAASSAAVLGSSGEAFTCGSGRGAESGCRCTGTGGGGSTAGRTLGTAGRGESGWREASGGGTGICADTASAPGVSSHMLKTAGKPSAGSGAGLGIGIGAGA